VAQFGLKPEGLRPALPLLGHPALRITELKSVSRFRFSVVSFVC
jgi:hypothetical protein